MFKVRRANLNDVNKISNIHIESIPKGFLTSLGVPILDMIYEGIILSRNSVVYVVEIDDIIVGFSAASLNISETYRNILKRKAFIFFIKLFPNIIKPLILKRIFQTLLYPSRRDLSKLPKAESLATGVNSEFTHLGISYFLLKEVIKWFDKKNVKGFKTIVYDGYKNNKVLKILGFKHILAIEHHGLKDNVYIYDHFHRGKI